MGQIIYNLQDMTYLNWAKARNSSGTAGSFLKAYEDTPSHPPHTRLNQNKREGRILCVDMEKYPS